MTSLLGVGARSAVARGRCQRKGTGRTQWAIPTTTIATAMPKRARLTAVEAMPHALPRGGEQRVDREQRTQARKPVSSVPTVGRAA